MEAVFAGLHAHLYALSVLLPVSDITAYPTQKDPLCKVAASYKKAKCDFLVGKEPTANAVHRAKPLVWF